MVLFGDNMKISFSKKGDYRSVAANAVSTNVQKVKHSKSAYREYADDGYYDDVPTSQLHLKPFDPNTADAATLEGLGLARWQVKTILRYRSKGGEYRTPEDFARVYKLTARQYKRIRPYIRISSDYQPASRLFDKDATIVESEEDNYRQYAKIGKGEYLTLNVADTAELRHVPGIGPFYANEIYQYARRLGGYVDVDQLSEIPNFPEKSKQYFQIDLSKVKKLNVNKVSMDKLRAHPYINYYQARTIVEFRHKYGNIQSLDQLKLSQYFTAEDLERIKPYVEY